MDETEVSSIPHYEKNDAFFSFDDLRSQTLRCASATLSSTFVGRVVDFALYETKVLGSKPPLGGLSTNP